MGTRIGRIAGTVVVMAGMLATLPSGAGAVFLPPQSCPGSGFDYTSNFTLPVGPEGYKADCTYQAGAAKVDVRTGIPTISLPIADGVVIDAAGHLMQLAPPEAETFDVTQAIGVVSTVSGPSDVWTVSYDASGRVTHISGVQGSTTIASIDITYTSGRITNIDYGLRDESFTYDATGHLTGWTDSGGDTASLSYDSAGRLSAASLTVSHTDPDDSYTYDAGGNLTSWTHSVSGPSQTLSFTHDSLGNVTSVNAGSINDATLSYSGAHKLAAVAHGASAIATFTYDAAGRLAEAQGTSTTDAFAYNAAGQMISTNAGGMTTTLAYDVAGRVTSFHNPSGSTVAITYLPGPQATTGAANSVGHTTAKLTGTVNPAGLPTMYSFIFGKTTRYGSSTPAAPAGSATPVNVSASLTHLTPGTTYHYTLVATNRNGTAAGTDRTFRTPPYTCTVPHLIGDTLKQAGRALRRHRCRLGKVSRPRHVKRHAHLTVSAQHPAPGAHRRAGAKVSVVLS